MRAIYQPAKCVKIWLGLPGNEAHQAFDLARELVHTNGFMPREIIHRPRELQSVTAFQSLLHRPYWNRVWVIQEVYSAKRAARGLVGDKSIPWNLLLEAQECLNRNQKTLWGLLGDQPSLIDFISDIWYRGPRGLRSETEESELTLFDALRWHSDKLSTRPEYKIILGVRQIYIDNASYIIQSTQRIDVICGLQYRTRNLFNLLSWVVDWTDIYNGCLMNLHPDVFQADGGQRAEVNFGSDGASLTVKGSCIGTIEALGQHKLSEQQGEYQGLLALCSDFQEARSKTGCVLLSELIRFCKNLTRGRILEDVEILADQPEEDALKIILALFFLWDPEQYIRPSTIISENLAEISPLWSNEKLEKWGSLILKDLKRVFDPRRFFICENGLQGSASHQASIGCKIYILFGCQTPIVLRPVSGLGEHDVPLTFEIVGDAYIDGYMNGKVMQENRVMEEFVIV